MKKYWLVIFPDTFIWIKNDNGIIYNSKNYKYRTFYYSNSIKGLNDTLANLDSLYSVEITELSLKDKAIENWIGQIIELEAGCLIEQNGQNKKMVSYYPVLSVQNDVKKIMWEHEKGIGGKIIENLHELVFYLNGSPHGSGHYFKQTYYPIKTEQAIDVKTIVQFINQCRNKTLNQITIIGDIESYSEFEQLKNWMVSCDLYIHLIVLAEDVGRNFTKLDCSNFDNISASVIVNNDFQNFRDPAFFQGFNGNVTFRFPVRSVEQFESTISWVESSGINDYQIIPLYDGKNNQFFEENIYMSPEDFDTVEMSKREVFSNMALNIHLFGKLFILPDHKIYSNVNNLPLGTMGDPIYNLIYKEMTEEKAWFRIRDMKPCSDCIYQWLCPSPGNYELAIGKPNLCHITV
jgi:pseudo-rSAM protein